MLRHWHPGQITRMGFEVGQTMTARSHELITCGWVRISILCQSPLGRGACGTISLVRDAPTGSIAFLVTFIKGSRSGCDAPCGAGLLKS